MRFVTAFLLLLACDLAAQSSRPASTGSQLAEFSLVSQRAPLASLVGRWRFHQGDDPLWARSGFDDSGWALLRSDLPWNSQGYPTLTGYAWYRFSIELPADNQQYSLVLPTITDSYQVFLDGNLAATIGQPGNGNAQWNTWSSSIDLPRKDNASCCMVEVALRVWRAPDGLTSGGPRSNAYSLVADKKIAQEEVRAARLWRWTLLVPTIPIAIVHLFAGLICLALFLQSRRDKEYLWFSLYALLVAAGSSIDVITHGHVVNIEHVNDLPKRKDLSCIGWQS